MSSYSANIYPPTVLALTALLLATQAAASETTGIETLVEQQNSEAAEPSPPATLEPESRGETTAQATTMQPLPSFLSREQRNELLSALRRTGISEQDLGFSRDYVNYGNPEAPDRWRLPAARQALSQPLQLPQLASSLSFALSQDLDPERRLSLTGFSQVVREQLGPASLEERESSSHCTRASNSAAGLIDQSLAHEANQDRKWSRREARELREKLDERLDTQLGALLNQARLQGCRVAAALSTLEPDRRKALVAVIEDSLSGDPATPPSEDEELHRFELLTQSWDAIDQSALLSAGTAWSEAVAAATINFSSLPSRAWPQTPILLPTDLGEVWIGSPDSNSGSGDPVLLVDPGGDDHWRIASSRSSLPEMGLAPVRAWIDLGGNDHWQGGAGGPGGALLSIAAGVDLAGDDSYRSELLSLAGASFGHATWLDLEGDDSYLSSIGSQGFASFGAALLRDTGAGADLYQAGFLSQAASHGQGIAILHDAGGPDRYLLGGLFEDNPARLPGHYSSCGQGFSIGMRPYAGGGLAWLLDESGHDQYVAGLWAQGASYWHSIAGLVDRDGNDLYSATQYGQGSGIHLSSAGLFDGGGDDRYLLANLGQGSGHDLAVSWLIDESGNDLYSGINLLQGAAITNSVSFFVDGAGDDHYLSSSSNSRGQSSPARGFGSIAAFLDLGGKDRYLQADEGTGQEPLLVRGKHGIFMDALTPAPSTTQASAAQSEETAENPASKWQEQNNEASGQPLTTETSATGEGQALSKGARELLLDNVLYLASSDATAAAVARLAAGGVRVLRLLLPLTSDSMILRSYTIERVIEQSIKNAAPDELLEISEAVARAASLGEARAGDARGRWHLRWLGKLSQAHLPASEAAIAAATALLRHPAWRVRKAAWTLIAEIAKLDGLELSEEDQQQWGVKASLMLQDDPIVEVRAAAARALAALGSAGHAPGLVSALSAPSFDLRDSAEQALSAIIKRSDGIAVARALFPLASNSTSEEATPLEARNAALRLLGKTQHRDAWQLLEGALAAAQPSSREAALQGALALRARGLRAALETRSQLETDSQLRKKLQAALQQAWLR